MSAKGLEWALRLRADLQVRIGELREALADIEPLRVELARLEGQLKGVERLVAVYHEQRGYPTSEEVAQSALPSGEAAMRPAPEAVLVPVEAPESPTLVAILRAESSSAIMVCRKGAALTREAAMRFWLSMRAWISERISRRNALS